MPVLEKVKRTIGAGLLVALGALAAKPSYSEVYEPTAPKEVVTRSLSTDPSVTNLRHTNFVQVNCRSLVAGAQVVVPNQHGAEASLGPTPRTAVTVEAYGHDSFNVEIGANTLILETSTQELEGREYKLDMPAGHPDYIVANQNSSIVIRAEC